MNIEQKPYEKSTSDSIRSDSVELDRCDRVLHHCCMILLRASQLSILLIPTIAHEVLIAISFLRRGAPKQRLTAWHARCLAYFSSYLFLAFTIAASAWRRDWVALTTVAPLRTIGAILWLFGALWILLAVWSVRRSFNIEPQARELVVSGPYTFARHPIYLSYVLQFAGIVLSHMAVPYVLCYCTWFVMMFFRARFEERVLQASFPEYEAYRERVWMFGPNPFSNQRSRVCSEQ